MSIVDFCEELHDKLSRIPYKDRQAGISVNCSFKDAHSERSLCVRLETNICGDWVFAAELFDEQGCKLGATEGMADSALDAMSDLVGEGEGEEEALGCPLTSFSNVSLSVVHYANPAATARVNGAMRAALDTARAHMACCGA